MAGSKPAPGDFSAPSSPAIDSNTNAVILFDLGNIRFIGNKHGWFSPVFKVHERILILNKKAIDQATVEISLDTRESINEKIDNVAASTFNLEGGKVVETKLDKKEFFKTRENKDFDQFKFTLPAVREGSIIDYTYTLTSDFDHELPAWIFQSREDPCMWSDYQVEIPQTMSYAVLKQGYRSFDISEGSEGHQSYKVTQHNDNGSYGSQQDQDLIVTANTIKHRWVMKDIPAFHSENWLSSPVNYIEKIVLQQSGWNSGQEVHAVSNSWKQYTEELLHSEWFGKPIKDDNEWLDPLLDKILAGNPPDQCRAIYYYVKDHYTCTGYGRYIETSLKDVVKKNAGSVGEINLLMIAMLHRKGIRADPVLLSTREMGFNLASYPMDNRLRYVVARVYLPDGSIQYLDASQRELGFGQLAGNCYNGHARIISDLDSGSVYFEADSLLEKSVTLVIISAAGQKGLEGSYQSVLGMQESYNTRYHVAKDGIDKYFKGLPHGELEIGDHGIDSLDKLEDPVKVHYNFVLKQPDASLLYVNPIIGDENLTDNPFIATQRKYPVEVPYVIDDLYNFSIQIPEGYKVDEVPKSARITLNGNDGQFDYLISQDGQRIQVRCHLALKKAFFAAEDYNNLRDFFSVIAKKKDEMIVFKKNN